MKKSHPSLLDACVIGSKNNLTGLVPILNFCCLLRNSGPSVQDKYLRLMNSLGIATQNYPASSNNLAARQETISCS